MIDGDDTLPLLYLPKQHEIYSHTKAIADQLVLDCNSRVKGGLLTTCLRPSGIFGEGTDTAKSFIERAAAGKMNIQMGNGKNLFDFTFIDNVVHAHILAAQALLRSRIQPLPDDMRVAGEGFIITNDEPNSSGNLVVVSETRLDFLRRKKTCDLYQNLLDLLWR